MRGAGTTSVNVCLKIGLAERHSRRTTIDDAAHGGAVAFAKRRDREDPAYGVARHFTARRLYTRCACSCSAVSKKTPPPPRSKSHQKKGGAPKAPRHAVSVL